MDELWLLARILFGALFVGQGVAQLADLKTSVQYAGSRGVAQGPAQNGVVASGVAFVIGGVSVIFGVWGDLGALLLIITLVPVTYLMHKFWAERDPGAKQTQLAMFTKNIALIGGAVLLFSFFARDTFGFGLPYTITDGAFSFR
jgi:putative oxidoreductase